MDRCIKTVLINVPSPWEGTDAHTVQCVNAALEREADGGKWTLVGTEMLVPRQGPERKLLAIFRRGKG